MSNAKVISELLERGKQSGKLSTKEITDAIEEMDIDAEQINKLYDDLEANNIETTSRLTTSTTPSTSTARRTRIFRLTALRWTTRSRFTSRK